MPEIDYRKHAPIFQLIATLLNQNGGKWKDPRAKDVPGPGPEDMYDHIEVMLMYGFGWAVPEWMKKEWLQQKSGTHERLNIPTSMARDLMQARKDRVLVASSWAPLLQMWARVELTAKG